MKFILFFQILQTFFFFHISHLDPPTPPPPPSRKIMVYSTRHYGLRLPRDSHEDGKLGVIVSLLQVYRVSLVSALTLSRGTSRCIVGF